MKRPASGISLLICILLFILVLGVFLPEVWNGFVNYDDYGYVLDNTHVTSGLTLENVRWAFRNSYAANWHPVTWLSHMLDCQLFGLQPWGHHLTSVLLHALNAVLVFILLRQMTGATWRSLLVAALFAVHPLRVESVAWVSERKDVLSGSFGLLALIFYVRYVQKKESKAQSAAPARPRGESPKSKIQEPIVTPGIGREEAQKAQSDRKRIASLRFLRLFAASSSSPPAAGTPVPPPASSLQPASSPWYYAALSCFALGLLSKPMLVTWPFVMLLLDYWPLGRFARGKAESKKRKAETDQRLLTSSPTLVALSPTVQGSTVSLARSPLPLFLEKAPFFALAAAASVVTFLVQQHWGAVTAVERLPLGARGANALISYCRYLGKLFWPTDLAVFYPFPGRWPLATVLLAGLVLLGVTAGALYWGVDWANVGKARLSERAGVRPPALRKALLFCGRVLPFAARWGQRALPSRCYPYLAVGWLWFLGTLVPVIGLVQVGGQAMADRYTYLPLIGILIALTWAVAEWTGGARSPKSEVRNPKPIAEFGNSGEKAQEAQKKLSFPNFLRFLRLFAANFTSSPAMAVAGSTALILCLVLTRQQIRYWKDSETLFRHALDVTDNNYVAHGNLGDALRMKGQLDGAISQLQEAIRLKPDYAAAHLNLGIALDKRGQLDAAISQFQEASRLQPGAPKARFNFGIALGKKGQLDEAISELKEASRLMPDDAEAHYTLGLVLGLKGQTEAAIRQYQEAIRLKPDYADAYDQLGDIYAALNQRGQAAEAWRKSLSIAPNREVQKKLDALPAP